LGRLFNRTFALNLGGTLVSSETTDGARNEILRVTFQIEKSLTESANTAEISVYNLAEQTRAKVSEKALLTTLEVGYSGQSSIIFKGQLEAGTNQRDGVDWVTSFQSTDGGKQLRESRINVSFKTISASDAMQKIVNALGVGIGNAKEKIAQGNIRGALDDFKNGLVLSGPTKRELTRLTKTLGYDWSIQDGQLQLLAARDAIEPGDAIVLNPDKGLIGSPESGENGIIEARALLIPQLTPGRVVRLESEQIEGFYRVEKVAYQGDTHGQDWYADLELKPR
jgi:hypothetical protein